MSTIYVTGGITMKTSKPNQALAGAIGACLYTSILCSPATLAAAADPPPSCHDINIPAQSVSMAVKELASQTGAKLLFSYEEAQIRQSQTVKGCYSLSMAIEALLKGSG